MPLVAALRDHQLEIAVLVERVAANATRAAREFEYRA